MLNKERIFVGVFIVFLVLSLLGFTSAITGSIGNARMNLNANKGDVIEKDILIKNVNPFVVNVTLSSSGDLKDHISFEESSFVLQPDEEVDAKVKITVVRSGTSVSYIDVEFNSAEDSKKIKLSSTITIVAENKGIMDSLNDEEKSDRSSLFNRVRGVFETKNNTLLFVILLVLLVLLLVLILFGSKRKKI